MIAAWMLYAALWTVWLSMVAIVIERALLRARVPVRGVWTVALLLSIASPFIGGSIARRRAEIPVVVAQPSSASAAPIGEVTVAKGTAVGRISPRTDVVRLALVADRSLLAGWIALSVIALAYVVGGFIHLRYLRRRWRRAVLNGTPVMVSDDVGPAVVGVVRSTIVVPEWALTLERDAISLMLRHEVEHQRAGDVRLLAVARLAAIAMPWNLALWWQLRRLRFAVEMDCDARVLRSVSDVGPYGRLLLECGRPRRTRRLAGTALAAHGTQLERRIRMMTQSPSRGRAAIVSACAVFGAGALLVACQLPAPRSSQQTAATPATMVSATGQTPADTVDAKLMQRVTAALTSNAQLLASFDSLKTLHTDSLQRTIAGFETVVRDTDSLLRKLNRLERIDTRNHPLIRELTQLLDSRAFTSSRAAPIGCAAGPVADNISVVKLMIPDTGATTRGGRVFFRSEVAMGTGVRAEYGRRETNLDFGHPAVTCESSDPAEIRLWLPGPFDVAPIVIRTARQGFVIVTTMSGDTLAGPVAVENAARSFELTWLRR